MGLENLKPHQRSGSWTPAFTNLVNLDGAPTVLSAKFGIVGNLVTFHLRLTVDPTASAAASFDFSVPVIPQSDFGDANSLAGTSATLTTVGVASSVAASKTAVLNWTASAGTAETLVCVGSYLLP